MSLYIRLPERDYNLELLDESMRASVPTFRGLSNGRGITIAVLADNASRGDEAAIITIANNHNANAASSREQVMANIRSQAQSSVGVALQDLSSAQVRALLAALLYRSGAIHSDGTVRPLAEWL